jgi:hypothetical protein
MVEGFGNGRRLGMAEGFRIGIREWRKGLEMAEGWGEAEADGRRLGMAEGSRNGIREWQKGLGMAEG